MILTAQYMRKMGLFVFLMLIFALVLCVLPKFIDTNYYTDRDMAFAVVQGLSYEEGLKASAKYINHFYWVYNSLCHLFGFLFSSFLIILLHSAVKLLTSKKYFDILKKICVYIWVNISYFIWAILIVDVYMNDLSREVLDSCHDSLGIPLIGAGIVVMSFALIYYPFINILTFFSYNKKLQNKFFNIIFAFLSLVMLLLLCLEMYSNFVMAFLPESIIINFINIAWFLLGLKYLKTNWNMYKASINLSMMK